MNRRQLLLALLLVPCFPAFAASLDLEDIGALRDNAGLDAARLEKQLAEQYWWALNQGKGLGCMGQKVPDEGAQAALKSIAAPLWAASTRNLHWRIALTTSTVINACTPGGGVILVNAGLVAVCREEADLAGVIAHEIGHIQHKHAIQRLMSNAMRRELGLRINYQVLELASRLDKVSMQILMATTVEVIHRSYTRLWEYQADAFIIRAFRKAGYSPTKASGFFRQLQNIFGAQSPKLCVYHSHPVNAERIRRLEAIADSYQGSGGRADSSAFQQLKRMAEKS